MQAYFVHAGVAGSSVINIEHRKEKLEFSAASYQRSFQKGVYEPFEQINRYWARLSEKDQDRVFQLYLNCKNVFNTTFQVTQLILNLRPIINELISFHDTNEFDHWVRIHGRVWIPNDLATEYLSTHERPGSREQTYLVSDYWELVFAVLKYRTIAPIWGEFMEATRRESGATFKELNAYYLITKTSIFDSPAMDRLNGYVAKNIKQVDINIRAAIEGIGSSTFQPNMVGGILVRVLSVASLTKEPSETHLVQMIHNAIRNKLSQNDSYQNAVLEKSNPDNSESEDSSSKAELYKNKTPVAPGEITAIEKYTEYTTEIAARLLLKNELTKEETHRLNLALKSTDAITSIPIEEVQIRLIQWTVSPIIPARALWDINRSSVLRLAGIAQFVLWESGYKDLAGIATARSLNAEGYGAYGSESRAHIPKDLVDKLNELYPYHKRHPTKKPIKIVNDAVTDIMKMSQELSDHTWFLNMDDDSIESIRGSNTNKIFRVGHDIRTRLAEYVIYLQQRNKEYLSLYQFTK